MARAEKEVLFVGPLGCEAPFFWPGGEALDALTSAPAGSAVYP